MSNQIFQRRVFWKDCFRDYFEITHLHGFKELHESTNKFEKIFWTLIIIGAFAFTGFLIYKSVDDYLDDKKQTFIKYEKYGNITMPMLYCPSAWVDFQKIKNENIPEHFVIYALSYLRSLKPTYVDEIYFGNIYDINVTVAQYCNVGNKTVSPDLIFLVPFLEQNCLHGPIPDYYSNVSRTLIKSLTNVTKVIDATNIQAVIEAFESCQKNKSEEVWSILYNRFHLSTESESILTTKMNLPGEVIRRFDKCQRSKYAIALTLHDIDNLFNASHNVCEEIAQKSVVKTDILCSVYNDAIMFYMFNGDALRSYVCTGNCEAYRNLERRRSDILSKVIATTENYANYLTNNNYSVSYANFKRYINEEVGGSIMNQISEVAKIRMIVEERFKQKEKEDFDQFLKQRNLSIFDLFRSISFDKSKFLLGMSVDPYIEIKPRKGVLKVAKVINAYGVCYQFVAEADMVPITDLPTTLITKINRRRKINEKLYVNIVELDKKEGFKVRSDDNIFIIGVDSRMLVPSRYSFDIATSKDWREHYYSFELANLAYQPRPKFTECRDNVKNHADVTYSYCNCIANCFNNYDQPKYLEAQVQKKAYCKYISESTFEDDNTTLEYCSWFTSFSDVDHMNMHDQETLDSCNGKCLQGCEVITFDIKSTVTNCADGSNTCVFSYRPPNVRKGVMEKSLLVNYYENLSKNGSPIWMKPFKYGDTKTITIADMIHGITEVSAPPLVRIEVQINSDVSYYTTHTSMEWDGYLGVVGGQVNLVVSGSLLTVFQLIWWFTHYFYNQNQMPSPRQSLKQGLVSTNAPRASK